jgi:hypothetical protein
MGLTASIIPSISSACGDSRGELSTNMIRSFPFSVIRFSTRPQYKQSLDGNNVHCEGLFRLIDIAQLHGMYQPHVFKWFKRGFADLSEQYHRFPDKIYGEVYMIIDEWNQGHFSSISISLLNYEVNSHDIGGHVVEAVTEAFLPLVRKFNSNSGWVSQSNQYPNEIVQSLSHYSYHSTGGLLVLCDIQGLKTNN